MKSESDRARIIVPAPPPLPPFRCGFDRPASSFQQADLFYRSFCGCGFKYEEAI